MVLSEANQRPDAETGGLRKLSPELRADRQVRRRGVLRVFHAAFVAFSGAGDGVQGAGIVY